MLFWLLTKLWKSGHVFSCHSSLGFSTWSWCQRRCSRLHIWDFEWIYLRSAQVFQDLIWTSLVLHKRRVAQVNVCLKWAFISHDVWITWRLWLCTSDYFSLYLLSWVQTDFTKQSVCLWSNLTRRIMSVHAPSMALEVCLWTLDVWRVAWALDVVVAGALLLERCCWSVVAGALLLWRVPACVLFPFFVSFLTRVLCWRAEY